MKIGYEKDTPRNLCGLLGTGSLLVLLFMTPGCPTVTVPPNDDPIVGDPGPDDPVAASARIDSILGPVPVSVLGPDIDILYSVTGTPDLLQGFYVEVSGSQTSIAGDRVIVAASLFTTGEDLVFPFSPSFAGLGFYRVGLLMTVDGVETEILSSGVIEVQGAPDPCFTEPCVVVTSSSSTTDSYVGCSATCQLINVVPLGDADGVLVKFDIGDPQGLARWRLFYLSKPSEVFDDRNADLLGTEIAIGGASPGEVIFATGNLTAGDYEIGRSTTDSGLLIKDTVAADGGNDRIVTITGPMIQVGS